MILWICLIVTSTQPLPEKLADVLSVSTAIVSTAFDGTKYLSIIALLLIGRNINWRIMWPSALFVSLMALSIPLSLDPIRSAMVVVSLLVTLLVSIGAGKALSSRQLVGGALIGLTIVLLLSLFTLRESIYAPATGIFGTRNELARICSYSAALAASGFLIFRNRRSKVASGLAFLFSSGLCIYSESATALTTLLIFLVALIVLRIIGWPPGIIEIGISSIVAAAVTISSPYILLFFFKITGRDLSLTGRTDVWEYAWKAISERPGFGYGAEAFWTSEGGRVGRLTLGDAFVHSHNTWIELFLSLGIIGGSLAIVSLGLQVILVLRHAILNNTPKMLINIFLALTAVTILYGFSEHAAYRPLYSIVFIYLSLSVSLVGARR